MDKDILKITLDEIFSASGIQGKVIAHQNIVTQIIDPLIADNERLEKIVACAEEVVEARKAIIAYHFGLDEFFKTVDNLQQAIKDAEDV